MGTSNKPTIDGFTLFSQLDFIQRWKVVRCICGKMGSITDDLLLLLFLHNNNCVQKSGKKKEKKKVISSNVSKRACLSNIISFIMELGFCLLPRQIKGQLNMSFQNYLMPKKKVNLRKYHTCSSKIPPIFYHNTLQ